MKRVTVRKQFQVESVFQRIVVCHIRALCLNRLMD